jgi:hypothetical protein
VRADGCAAAGSGVDHATRRRSGRRDPRAKDAPMIPSGDRSSVVAASTWNLVRRSRRASDVSPGNQFGRHEALEREIGRRGPRCSGGVGVRRPSRHGRRGRRGGVAQRRVSATFHRVRWCHHATRDGGRSSTGRSCVRPRHGVHDVGRVARRGRGVAALRPWPAGGGRPSGRHQARSVVATRRDEARDFWRAPVNPTKGASGPNPSRGVGVGRRRHVSCTTPQSYRRPRT